MYTAESSRGDGVVGMAVGSLAAAGKAVEGGADLGWGGSGLLPVEPPK